MNWQHEPGTARHDRAPDPAAWLHAKARPQGGLHESTVPVSNWFRRFMRQLRPARMIVRGNDVVGWTACYDDDDNAVWSPKQENAVRGCRLRRRTQPDER
ncbi:hypothetical protein [Variovorax jilinensis]|uniref:hypothetical protein n=1 Tax=Variovorax jilinensis TaxID=3053513 RepID=UPI002577F053|nr:hypothetical protein [Variovorax sp. J22P168]